MAYEGVNDKMYTISARGFPCRTLVVPTKRTIPRRGVSPLPPSTMTSVPTGTWSIDCTGMGGSGAREAARPAVAAMAGGALPLYNAILKLFQASKLAGVQLQQDRRHRPTYRTTVLSDPDHPDGADTLEAPRTPSHYPLGQQPPPGAWVARRPPTCCERFGRARCPISLPIQPTPRVT